MADEAKGMETVTGFLNVVRQMEIERRDRHGTTNHRAANNGWKGYVPALVEEGANLIVADASQHEHLVRRGYVRIGDYQGDARERFAGPRSYYQTTVGGKAQFRQGVAQTVHETWQGVDSRTGATTGGNHAGLVIGRKAERIAAATAAMGRRGDDLVPGDYLLPIFDEAGNVAGYERPMDPARMEMLPRDEHLGRMLGVWAGRILEETVSDRTNSDLVAVMKEIWTKAEAAGEAGQFVNVADPELEDAVIKDAWDTLGWRIKAEIAEAFGPKTFMVRRDMVDDAIGYRAASVTDVWTGVSRWSETSQEHVRQALEMVGPGAFKWLRRAENLTEADVAIREGRWSEYLEKATDRLPDWAATGAKNLLLTKDTALFQGLNRMVQYGDFVAKAARLGGRQPFRSQEL